MPRRDNLARYREKRDFTKTAEPKGILKKKTGQRYLIQKHAARRLHYDFRLELDGTLKSWAVTRGPSLDPHERRLAVEVEDHPVAYGSFEGTIPQGQYGGGTVMLWDEGSWEPIGDPREGLKKGKLEFILHGERLRGEWTLVRMKSRGEKRNNWLLIKRSDDEAREGDEDQLLQDNVSSISSKRSMEEIAAGKNVWQSNRKTKAEPVAQVKKKPAREPSKTRSKLPKFETPQLATLTDAVPQGENWVHEVKFDGYRTLAYISGGEVRMLTRTGQDWTHKFKDIAEVLEELPTRSALIDGEIVAPGENGISSFKHLQKALSEGKGELQYYVFDLLSLDGKDLTALPLLQRKKQLKKLMTPKIFRDRVIYSEHFSQGEDDLLQNACRLHMEGIISKRSDAPYTHARSKTWLKTKCHKRQEFVIGGFTLPTHKQRGVGALLLGYYEDETLRYAGKVGTGFDGESAPILRKKLDRLKQASMPFDEAPSDARRAANWVQPKLVCEVEFTEWTGDGRLRHPSFQGLREDKPAKKVRRDHIMPVKKITKTNTGMDKKTSKFQPKTGVQVEGVTITHPDRKIYPGSEITKLQLAEYYAEVADHILPHLVNRPISMVRCPEGTGKECFFQRHVGHGQSPHLYDANVKVKGRTETYVMIKDVKGLITLVQWGVIEIHPWGCLADKPHLPDRIIFDLDPDPAVRWEKVIEGAAEIRERMNEFGLTSFLKTTGGKGLHVVMPLSRKYEWPTIKAFAKAVAESMMHDNPQRYISKSSKLGRKGKIFVDYLRNDLTSTAVAPFSARARKGAPVATPLEWSELKASLKPSGFTVETIPTRLGKMKKDPWKDMQRLKQALSARYLEALRIKTK